MTPLYDMSPTTRFGDRAADYAKHRPSYPAAAIDAIVGGLGGASRLLAADVGAGTGISARLLADRGVTVIAIEPNASMRRAALSHPRVRWCDGTAEATGLGAGSMHLVLCAQAFHWFRPAAALSEFHRVLRPRGRLALMWNRRSTTDAFTVGYRDALLSAGVQSPMERMDFNPDVIVEQGFFSPPTLTEVPNDQMLDLEGFIGRAMSASYVPKSGPAAERLMATLRALHAQFRDPSGFVILRHTAQVWLSERL